MRRVEFMRRVDALGAKLVQAGYRQSATVMVDDARQDGVTNFGRSYSNGRGETVWVNYKTMVGLEGRFGK